MQGRKRTKRYYFSVEGETEQWYLEWLRDKINRTDAASYKVSFDCSVRKTPIQRAKSIVFTGAIEIWHLFDYESDEQIHRSAFIKMMDNMKEAEHLGKQIHYRFGYSNLAFELWVILHMVDCDRALSHRRKYLEILNRVYHESFRDMNEYKREANFKRCLRRLELCNVICAVKRAKMIMQRNEQRGYILQQYKGYKYYKENPSLAIHEIIEKIFVDCNLM